jgi:hypothetical protein
VTGDVEMDTSPGESGTVLDLDRVDREERELSEPGPPEAGGRKELTKALEAVEDPTGAVAHDLDRPVRCPQAVGTLDRKGRDGKAGAERYVGPLSSRAKAHTPTGSLLEETAEPAGLALELGRRRDRDGL